MNNLLSLFILYSCLFGYAESKLWAEERTAKPNILLIVVDDLGYADLSCMPNHAEDVSTPNIDKLAKQGVLFPNSYATAPICNASRIAILTGCYQQRQGQYWYSGPGLHNPKYTTIAETLKQAGYQTAMVGKIHHGKSDKPGKRGFPLSHGYDRFFGFSGGTKHYLHHAAKYKNVGLHEGPMYEGGKQKDTEGFATELFGERARAWISDFKDKPFFLHLSFSAVHNFTHQLPAAYLKAKGLKGFEDSKTKKDYWAWRKTLNYPVHPEGRAYYLGQLHYLDQEIGKLLTHLNELKLMDQTAIFFVSDNGGSLVTYANNGILNGGKYTLFEGGVRTPLIVKWPKGIHEQSAGTIKSSIVSTMDLYPTINALSNSKVAHELDGIDISTLIAISDASSDDAESRRPLYWSTGKQAAVRLGKWKYLKTKGAPNAKLQITATPIGSFLYDLSADPGEKQDVLSANPEVAERLERLLAEWQADLKS